MYLRSKPKLTVLLVLCAVLVANLAVAGQPVIHGIISQGYLKSTEYSYLIPSEEGSFAFNEMLLNVSASVTDNLRVGAQVMARNFGTDGNEDVVLDWAYGDYRWKDELGIRVGKVKTPFGFYNQTRDVDMVRNSILLPQAVYTERFRDVMNGFEGASLYGSLSVGSSSSLEYDAFVGTVDLERTKFMEKLILDPAMGAIFGSPLPTFGWQTETKSIYGGALRWNTPLDGLRVGASGFAGEMNGSGTLAAPFGAFRPSTNLTVDSWYVLSAEYTRDALVLAFEFTRNTADISITDVLVPTGMDPPAPATIVIDLEDEDRRGGWYGQATYQINDWFQLGGYYSQYYPDYSVRDAEGFSHQQRDLALTARFDITDYWLMKVEGHAMNGTGDVQSDLNVGNAMTEETWTLFGVKSTFYF